MKFQSISTFLGCLVLASTTVQSRRPPPQSQPASTTTTVASSNSEDDVYMAKAKELIDAGTCNSVSTNTDACGDSATSYYTDFVYNGRRVVVSSGVPDHTAEHDQLKSNPNERCERWMFMSLPLDVSKGSTLADTPMGTEGLAVTGGSFFNDLSSTDGSLAAYNELDTLDSCFGHSNQASVYHYHANINCSDAGAASGANDYDQCVKIGYFNDGVPVYGYCRDAEGNKMTSCYKTKDGVTVDEIAHVSGSILSAESRYDYEFDDSIAGCNLDEASGALHPTTGVYSYFTTDGYPWVPVYYYGSDGEQDLCSLDI